MRIIVRHGWLPAMLFTFIPSEGIAQAGVDTTRADSSARRLAPVRITETRSAGVVGGATSVILRIPEVLASPAPMLHEALRESPFVHVRLNSRGEAELSIRGSDSRQAAVLLDGVPITLGWDHRVDPSLIPITGTQQIEVVPGLGSLLNGPNALGGTVEVSHDDAMARNTQTWGGFGIDEFGATVASLGTARRVADLGSGVLAMRAGLSHRQRDGLALPSGVVDPTASGGLRTNTDLRELDGFASLRWSGAAGRSLGLTVSAFDAEKGVPPEEHILTPRLWRYPYHRRSIVAASANTGLRSTPFGFGSLELGAGLNSGRVRIESFADRTYETVTGVELGDERTMTWRAKLTHSAGSRATLRAAWTLADVQYTETLVPAAGVDYRQRLSSAGAEVETRLDEQTSVTTGLVFDRMSTPESGGREPAAEPFTGTGLRAGIARALGGGWNLHASANRRSRFPALRELYSGALNRFTPNPDLKPETLTGYESGVTFSGASAGGVGRTMRITGFHHTLDDAIVRITLLNPSRFKRVNRDRIESRGIEVLGGLSFGADRARAVSLTGDAMLQHLAIHDETAGDSVRHSENNPERRGSVELGVPLPWHLRGNLGARYTGRQYCLNGDTGAEMTLRGQAVANVAFEREVVPGGGPFQSMRTVLALDNVTDKAVYDQCGLPQPGRTLRVMFSFR